MRLTLRTLIAWLDDTLTPQEVREIGQLVSESPFAKELVERVQRVTRQRRLSVPGDLGTEPSDPNLVACYLDNSLKPEQVADYEKRCLTSDVHLAEVASVHQILSLIGQKAKVPPEAKLRMYRMIKGREASFHTTIPRPFDSDRDAVKVGAPHPSSEWAALAPRRRPLIERFGPLALVLGLITLLALAAAYSLTPDGNPSAVAINRPGSSVMPRLPVGPNPTPAPAQGASTDLPKREGEDASAEEPKADQPKNIEETGEGAPAAIEAIQGVVLRPAADGNGWDRAESKTPLKEGSRLLNLAPFRNVLKLGKSEVELVDSADVVIVDLPRDQPSQLELRRGRILVRPSTAPSPIAVRFEGKMLTVTPPTGVAVGIERIPTLLPGKAEPAPAHLRVILPEGEATLKAGEIQESLSGPGEITLQASGQFTEKGRQPPPSWVTEAAPSTYVKEIADQFVALLRPGRPILSDLVEAMDDPQKDVKRLAVEALGSIGAMELVVTVLDRKEEPTIHRAVVEVLRTGLAQGGESAKVVREALDRQYDKPWAEITERLIVGHGPEDARDEATIAKLVEYLAAPTRGTRELALDNLRALTGRDSMEYDPDNFEGKGLKAWQDLVRKKEAGKEPRPASGGAR